MFYNVQAGRTILIVVLLALFAVSLLPPAGVGQAATYMVCPSGCDYSSIQAAVDAAAAGDTILIGAGTYSENLDVDKGLTLSGAGPELTIIDGNNTERVLWTEAYPNEAAANGITLSGVTVQNGASSDGAGITNFGHLTLDNSRVISNTAVQRAGGIWNQGTLTVTNSLIADNSAGGGGGGVSRFGSAVVTVQNTIIAGNQATDDIAPDCSGDFVSQGHNLIGNNQSCNGFTHGANGDQVGGSVTPLDPRLAPLRLNGGATMTHALQPDSPAIDAGNPAAPGSGGPACAAADQRGFIRPIDGNRDGVARCDIGAFERGHDTFLPLVQK
jgi:hypothetical protein